MKENLNNKKLDALIRAGDDVRKALGSGLYFRIARNTPSWVVRYTIAGKRSQIALPKAYPRMSINEAKRTALEIVENAKLGIDPKSERKKAEFAEIRTVDQLFEDWHQSDLLKNLKNPQIPARNYRKEMKIHIGVMTVKDVTPQHIRKIIDDIVASDRPSVANKVLRSAKQMFNHAIKLNLITYNPAQAFTPKDAGGTEQSRDRALTLSEIEYAFKTLREQSHIFTRDNYLACCLLLCLGCRKGELIAAKWEHFSLDEKIWYCRPNKIRKNAPPPKPVPIPLSEQTITWLTELKVRSAGAEHVFPSRRRSKRRGYISDDTINHALAKISGMKVDSHKQPYPNMLCDIEPFTVHDLRRTCRSLLAKLGTPEHIAERCVNHKVKGLVGIYDRHSYLDERREALDKLSALVSPYL
ncbi:tyrosine-type recombinase/integrase [Vibrio parahaemolyticus]|uniref:tyrosine-type recombinase/integrase n=1 Tax=Vibrio parahaemolyticus TaxID=670 RepID=UPI000A1EC55D|nr:integrase family protein [Vibrio parahaemolyticus]ELA6921387.1 integrase family protein [Vibrio parahaemolyticus]MBE4096258.1 integrase family protein [Vibrio parahaemolyticus]MBE4131192.1 integrase family protein [Vibrio parahaemolyticus]MBM4853122.1 integrase family protein [Vibrio parahaemolyticus]MBX5336652.1 integrase family protein [Vibrio parahaemolyticus]